MIRATCNLCGEQFPNYVDIMFNHIKDAHTDDELLKAGATIEEIARFHEGFKIEKNEFLESVL